MKFSYIILFYFFSNGFIPNKYNFIKKKSFLVLNDFNKLLEIDNEMYPLVEQLNKLKKEKYKLIYNKNKLEDYKESIIELDKKMTDILLVLNKLKKEKNALIGNQKGIKLDNNQIILDNKINDEDEDDNIDNNNTQPLLRIIYNTNKEEQNDNPESFQIVKNMNLTFKDIGGYENIKKELNQVADILVNYTKYSKFNIRTPKGLILEGPPGTGKTLIAKCFCGEINVNFIAVSGSEFQEKYIGVGSKRIRELFKIASNNVPCIIFIDEIDAIGRKRSSGDDAAGSERDSTLNQLLVMLDGFKSNDGVFIIGATNRKDLLDHALVRPGRIDKTIFMGLPDEKTRESIINIHIKGKPYDETINVKDLTFKTNGLSGAQIENLLNEAMLAALRENKEYMTNKLIEENLIKNFVGWQSTQHLFTDETIYKIAIHELGHAMVGYLTKKYNKLVKVSINLWSPTSPGLTQFNPEADDIMSNKDKLINQLAVTLGGRVAEELFFGELVTTAAVHDLEKVKELATDMIVRLGMGEKLIYLDNSDKSKDRIDEQVNELINIAYNRSKNIIVKSKKLIEELALILEREHVLTPETIEKKIKLKHLHLIYNDKFN